MNLQLPTGNTVWVSAYEFFFLLKDEDVDLFFQACIADNVGTYIDNPFSGKAFGERLEFDEEEDSSNVSD